MVLAFLDPGIARLHADAELAPRLANSRAVERRACRPAGHGWIDVPQRSLDVWRQLHRLRRSGERPILGCRNLLDRDRGTPRHGRTHPPRRAAQWQPRPKRLVGRLRLVARLLDQPFPSRRVFRRTARPTSSCSTDSNSSTTAPSFQAATTRASRAFSASPGKSMEAGPSSARTAIAGATASRPSRASTSPPGTPSSGYSRKRKICTATSSPMRMTADPGTAYLEDIKYTLRRVAGGGLQSIDNDQSRDRVLHFELESAARPDKPISYAAGFQRKLAHRLDYVDVSAGGQLIRRYGLGYATSEDSSRSLLTGVSVSGTNAGTAGAASFTTTFQYRTNKTTTYDHRGWASSPISWSWPSAGPLVAADRTDNGVRLGDVWTAMLFRSGEVVRHRAARREPERHGGQSLVGQRHLLEHGNRLPRVCEPPDPAAPRCERAPHAGVRVGSRFRGSQVANGPPAPGSHRGRPRRHRGRSRRHAPSTGAMVPLVGQWFSWLCQRLRREQQRVRRSVLEHRSPRSGRWRRSRRRDHELRGSQRRRAAGDHRPWRRYQVREFRRGAQLSPVLGIAVGGAAVPCRELRDHESGRFHLRAACGRFLARRHPERTGREQRLTGMLDGCRRRIERVRAVYARCRRPVHRRNLPQ